MGGGGMRREIRRLKPRQFREKKEEEEGKT